MKINMGYIAKREFDRVAAFIFFEGLKIKVRMLMPYPKRIESFLVMVYYQRTPTFSSTVEQLLIASSD